GYDYAPAGNRLLKTSLPGDDLSDPQTYSANYTYDEHGSMLAMNSIPGGLSWDPQDRLQKTGHLGGGDVFYVYDSAGMRVRKVHINQTGTTRKERFYLGPWETYRETKDLLGTPTLDLERETLHVQNTAGAACLIETKTVENASVIANPTSHLRYQHTNHLGTATLELSATAEIISYEEYHPYGTSSYRAANSSTDVSPKRYRYTGKERDEETGLYYHEARYYACWLGRWNSSDPIGLSGGINRFAYVSGHVTRSVDSTGTSEGDFLSETRQAATTAINAVVDGTGELIYQGIDAATDNAETRRQFKGFVRGAQAVGKEFAESGLRDVESALRTSPGGFLLDYDGATSEVEGKLSSAETVIARPILLVDAVVKPISDALDKGEDGEAAGRITGLFLTVLLGPGVGKGPRVLSSGKTSVRGVPATKAATPRVGRVGQRAEEAVPGATIAKPKGDGGASARNVNPTGRLGSAGRTQNCGNCVVATDATLAGHPATALPGTLTSAADVARAFGRRPTAWIPTTGMSGITTIMKEWGTGARGIVFGTRSGGRPGHFFNVANQGGTVRFIDGQTGKAAAFDGFNGFHLLRTN
ncbi:MAG TPA: hypothetical protein ENJ16_06105, partial [Planctomycetaceae bacterium]|nr:hypothetical protein [Planctomycetaceae bacterium]